ncbi:hypothetical protein BGV62_12255 [Burkholderia ubonensis]|nr:hypothetical protein BGV63_00085 [Burkholderia ubonensis]OJA31858.1 hypothetical protein BGV58_07475 [Burkholderia ubonensis]OJB64988.1 hypothetical protein BGV62_12255 [Burkholderia ubonensis]
MMKMLRAKFGKFFAEPKQVISRLGNQLGIDDVSENGKPVFIIFLEITRILLFILHAKHILSPPLRDETVGFG